MAIQGNQPILDGEVVSFFDQADAAGAAYAPLDIHMSQDAEHGRLEEREVTVSQDTRLLAGGASKDFSRWCIQPLIRERRKRAVGG